MPEARTPARPDEPDVGEFVRTCIPIGNVSRHMCDLAGPSWPILVLESHMAMVTRDEVGKPTNVLIVSGGLGCGTLTGAAVVTLSSAPLTRPRAGG